MKQKSRAAGARKASGTGLLILSACYFVLVLAMVLALSPERYSLKVGEIATKTITATKDIIDEETTEKRRQEAMKAVQPVYQEDEEAADRVLARLEDYFKHYETVREFGEKLRRGTIASNSGEEFVYTGSFLREDLDHAKALCDVIALSDWQLTILMKLSEAELNSTYSATVSAVRKAMDAGIRQSGIETAVSNIQRQAIQYISSDLCWNIAVPTVRACLEPNMVVNEEATEANRAAAAAEVEPVYYKNGQNVVVAGERVTAAEISVLETLGLLEGNKFDTKLFIGVVMVGVLSVLALAFYLLRFERDVISRHKAMLMLAVIFLTAAVLTVLSKELHPYFVPMAIVPLMVTAVLSPEMAVGANLFSLMFIGVLSNSADQSSSQQILSILFTGVMSAPIGIYIMRRNQQRIIVFIAGLAMTAVNVAAMMAIGLLTNNSFDVVLRDALWCGGGTLASSVLCIAFQPLMESVFNLVTPYKLLELSNPNHPLLRRLLVETPGTYHHAIMVANLAEAAAEAVGADPLLARVSAYYHDIGKLKRPLYFKENQVGENPHDNTDPRVSAAIISEHVVDGVKLAREYRLPQPVIDAIEQHHGDTHIAFFLHKMRTIAAPEDVREDDFRYPGPRPQTAEIGILMLADTAEAAVRAGTDQSTEMIEAKVRELVNAKIQAGQLDQTPLCFADVTRIVETFAQVLNGVYHQRIEYPKLDEVSARTAPSRPPQFLPGAAQRIKGITEKKNRGGRTAARQEEGQDASGDHSGKN